LYKTTEQEKLIIQKRHRQTATETVDPMALAGATVGAGIHKQKSCKQSLQNILNLPFAF